MRATPGSVGKPAADVIGQVQPKLMLLVQEGPVGADNRVFWRVYGVGGDGQPLTGWVAEQSEEGNLLLTYAPKLPGTNIPDKASNGYLGLPFSGVFPITQLFGENPEYYANFSFDGVPLKGNYGPDFALPLGTAVLAVDDGVIDRVNVEASDTTTAEGSFVKIVHEWGESVYTHLDSVAVAPGQVVKRGEVIGTSGNSGAAAAPFLGFAIRINPYERTDGWGGFSDPIPYFQPDALVLSGVTVTSPVIAMPAVVDYGASGGGAYVIFDRCIRDGACAEVCPVECIVPGQPVEEWPWYYVDPDTCIACGACVPECPVDAVLPMEDLPVDQQYAIELNALFFNEGPGYSALGMG